MTKNVFDYVNSVTADKKDLSDDPLFDNEYSPFLVNKALSMYPDTVLHANIINMYPESSKLSQYKFYLYSIRPKKRFAKWPKKTTDDELTYIRRFFECNTQRAEEIRRVLSDDQIKMIVTEEREIEANAQQ